MTKQGAQHEPGPRMEMPESVNEAFVICFNRFLQTSAIHDINNHLTIAAGKNFLSAGRRILSEHQEITVEARHERLFVQNERLLLRQQTAAVIFTMLARFDNMCLYGLKFNQGFSETSYRQAYELACILNKAPKQIKPLKWIESRLEKNNIDWVELISEPRDQSDLSSGKKLELAHRAYSYAYNSVKSVSHKIHANEKAGVRRAVRVVQDLIDLVFVDKSVLLGLATIRDYDDYTFTHSVNVAVQSMCLGHEIGLSQHSLVRLGICGLFHDLGKIDVPIEIINKPGGLDEHEFKKVQQHSLNSVREILKLEAYRDLVSKIILPPFEHHLKYDLTGYPYVSWSKPLSLFGRIIEICDVYDALTAPRIYRPWVLSPDRALGLMLSNSGKDFDPVLLKWFINMVGVYPVGTLVKLNTGEMGLVYKNSGENGRNPLILLLRRDQDGGYRAGSLVDIHGKDGKAACPVRKIESTHNAAEFGIQPAAIMMEADGGDTDA